MTWETCDGPAEETKRARANKREVFEYHQDGHAEELCLCSAGSKQHDHWVRADVRQMGAQPAGSQSGVLGSESAILRGGPAKGCWRGG